MKKEILRMQDVCVGDYEPYGLKDFRLHICEGEMVDILGLSGAGKTLLYEYFMGHMVLRKGKVDYNGSISREGEYFRGIMDVVCIGQDSTLIPGLSVAENIFIITGKRKIRGLIRMKNIFYRARILLGQYAPELSPQTLVWELTPAQMRIVELLRAVENEAKLVVIDDVFQGYGQKDILRISELLETLKNKGIGILYETHEMDFTRGLADRAVVLRKGQNVRTFYRNDYDERLCRRFLVGNEELPVFVRSSMSRSQVVFSARGLEGEYYVSDVDLDIHEGEIVGLYDLNNQKNMELLQIIMGQSPLKGGSLYLAEKRYEPRDLDYAIECNIGFIPRNMRAESLVGSMSFMDNLCLPVLKKTSRFKFLRDRAVLRFLGKEYMEGLGIPYGEKDTKVRCFDEYIQNSILLTRWLLFRPSLLVAMEPWGNADIIMRDIIFNAFAQMAQRGTAILIASQNMNELKTICDTIYVGNSDESSQFQKYEQQ